MSGVSPRFEVEGVAVRWDGRPIVVGASFALEAGERVSLSAPSGLVGVAGVLSVALRLGVLPRLVVAAARTITYQIVVMLMLAAACALGSIGVALLTFRRLFTSGHALRADRTLPRATE